MFIAQEVFALSIEFNSVIEPSFFAVEIKIIGIVVFTMTSVTNMPSVEHSRINYGLRIFKWKVDPKFHTMKWSIARHMKLLHKPFYRFLDFPERKAVIIPAMSIFMQAAGDNHLKKCFF